MANKRILGKINKRDGKHLLKSKTFWINVVVVLMVPLAPEPLKTYLLQPDVVTLWICLLNIGLRFVTSDKIYLK